VEVEKQQTASNKTTQEQMKFTYQPTVAEKQTKSYFVISQMSNLIIVKEKNMKDDDEEGIRTTEMDSPSQEVAYNYLGLLSLSLSLSLSALVVGLEIDFDVGKFIFEMM
jgi:hypothetical protein